MTKPPAVLTIYGAMPNGRITRTDLSLVETEPMQFRFVLSHDVDNRECEHTTGHDRYAFVWDACCDQSRNRAFRAMGVAAADPNLRLNWNDVTQMQWLANSIGRTIDPEKYAGYRQQS